MLIGLASALGAAVLYGVASVGQAVASRKLPMDVGWVRVALLAVRNPILLAVAAADLVGAGLHLVAIDTIPLYLAQAGIAAALPVTAVVSARVLREALAGPDWLAVAATGLGIAMLAGASGKAGNPGTSADVVLALYAVLGVLVVTGYLAYRGEGRLSGGVLSLLSGLGYSVATLGARMLGGPDWSWHTVALVAAVGLGGLLGFGLYSVALQRVPVAGATAPLVVSETVVPTVVGIVLLGDSVTAGRWPLVGAGMVLAMAGAVWLAGFEGRTLDRVREGEAQLSP